MYKTVRKQLINKVFIPFLVFKIAFITQVTIVNPNRIAEIKSGHDSEWLIYIQILSWFLQGLCSVLIIYLIVQEIKELVTSNFKEYFSSFWNLNDTFCIVSCAATIVL